MPQNIIEFAKRVLRQRFPKSAVLNLDYTYLSGKKSVMLGWCLHMSQPITSGLTARIGRREVALHSIQFDRADVQTRYGVASSHCFGFLAVVECGAEEVKSLTISHSGVHFACEKLNFTQVDSVNAILPHAGPDAGASQSFLKMHGIEASGDVALAPIVRSRPKDIDLEKIKMALADLNLHSKDFKQELTDSVIPAVHRIWKARQSKPNNASLHQFGPQISAPKLSIVVPLYGRYDFMQHQLASFSTDPEFREVELIYVLDDPPLAHEVLVTAYGVYETFKQPFKVVISERNSGFAGANNLGVKFASAERLLLLNSDILPVKSGWITRYLNQFDSLDNCGILGATLIYEDHTIQHAGMEFRVDSSYPGIWMNHHPFKGVPESLLTLDELFESQLTTGACMLMSTDLYRELDGFDPLYVLGDFEDSDLCLKVHDHGLKIYVSGAVKFYHLERLSQNLIDSGDWKFKLTMMNGVYQSNRWHSLISEVTK